MKGKHSGKRCDVHSRSDIERAFLLGNLARGREINESMSQHLFLNKLPRIWSRLKPDGNVGVIGAWHLQTTWEIDVSRGAVYWIPGESWVPATLELCECSGSSSGDSSVSEKIIRMWFDACSLALEIACWIHHDAWRSCDWNGSWCDLRDRFGGDP